MASRQLPNNPSLSVFKSQAKKAVRQHRQADPGICELIAQLHPDFSGLSHDEVAAKSFALHDGLLCIARYYGFPSWTQLKEHVEQLKAARKGEQQARADDFERLQESVQDLIYAIREGNIDDVEAILDDDPDSAHPKWEVGYEPSPLWHNDCIPLSVVSNAVFEGQISVGTHEATIAKLLLDAGADADLSDGHPLMAAVSFNALEDLPRRFSFFLTNRRVVR